MADTHLDRDTRAVGTSPFLWILVLVVLAVVVLWALGAWGANEAVSDDPAEPMSSAAVDETVA